jgi:hypothetical protein
MRAGNARTSVKPGRREEPGQSAAPCGPGAARRPYRHPIPGGLLTRNELSDLAARRVATASESKAATAPAWPRQVRSSHARAGAYDQPQTCLRGRTRISPATSRVLLGALVWKSASGQAHRRIVPAIGLASGEERHSGDGPAGPASLFSRISRPASRPGVDCAARPDCGSGSTPSRACASSPTRACGVPLGSRQLAIEK